jgi:hypothetical protein
MKTGALWFVGVALPLALTSLAGYGAWIVQQRRTARTAEESTYKKFIATQYTQLRDLFNVHLPNVVHNAPNDRALGAELLEALQQRGAVQPLPTDTRMSLLDALNNSDRRTMAATLRHAYPIWRMAIETAFNAAGDGE